MSLNIAILKEQGECEKRVAGVPETIVKLVKSGCVVTLQKDAGKSASYLDEDYKQAGAKIAGTALSTVKSADILLCIGLPTEAVLKSLKKGCLVIGGFSSHNNKAMIKKMAGLGLIGLAMELMPRISRAQSMDILSSQSNLSGYKSVLDATEHFTGALPMMMTAAGTVRPAKVFVMGAGVAGLQAIATAKRLGAIVFATDVRPASKEQVESLGGVFIAVENEEFQQAETSGGYAKAMSKDYQKLQQELVEETIAKQDIVITTALIPGREAPKLITEKMLKTMKTGSVIVDLAVEQGGNCAFSKAGEVINKYDVSIVGHKNVPSRLASVSSALFSNNLFNFMKLLIDNDSKSIKIDWDDEIIQGVALTKAGKIIHPLFTEVKKKPKAKAKPKAKTTVKKKTVKKTGAKK